MKQNKMIHIGLWVIQILLGALFLMAGLMKLTSPLDELAKNVPWVSAVPLELVRFIGLSELLGGLGLILPAATRIQPKLTPLAACGLVTIMALASVFHFTRGEYPVLPINFVLGGLAAFVAWGRFKKAAISPR